MSKAASRTPRQNPAQVELLNAKLLKYIAENEHTQVGRCLELGCNPNSFDPKSGETALIQSLRSQNKAIFDLLISHGAAIDESDYEKRTPLHYAAVIADPYFVDILLKNGASPDNADFEGKTPIDVAGEARNLKVYTMLLRASSKNEGREAKSARDSSQRESRLASERTKENLTSRSSKKLESMMASNRSLDNASIATSDLGTDRQSHALSRLMKRFILGTETGFSEDYEQTTQKATTLDQVLTLLRANNALEINVSFKHVTEEGFEDFCLVVAGNRSLTSLTVRDYKFGLWGISKLMAGLEMNATLTHLKLSHCKIGNDGASLVADWLGMNPPTKELWLDNNDIGEPGCAALGQAMCVNTRLEKLILRGNPLSDAGIKLLMLMFTRNKSLQELYLGGTQITDAGMKHIAHSIKGHPTLAKLELSANQIGESGASYFLQIVQSEPSKLIWISVDDNMIRSEDLVIAIKGLCRSNITRRKEKPESKFRKNLTRRVSESRIQPSKVFDVEKPRNIFVYRNGDVLDGPGIRIVVPKDMGQLIDLITAKLKLPFAARYLYLKDGTTINDMDQIQDQMTIIASTGDELKLGSKFSSRFPRSSSQTSLGSQRYGEENQSFNSKDSNQSTVSFLKSKWAQLSERPPIILARRNGRYTDEPVKIPVRQITVLRRHYQNERIKDRLWDDFLDDVTAALDLPLHAQKIYSSVGTLVADFLQIEDNMEVFASVGEEFKHQAIGGNSTISRMLSSNNESLTKGSEKKPPIIHLIVNGEEKSKDLKSVILPQTWEKTSDKFSKIDKEKRMQMLLDICAARLNLAWPARKIFKEDGTLITNIDEIKDNMVVVVSTGEPFVASRKAWREESNKELPGVLYKQKSLVRFYAVPNGGLAVVSLKSPPMVVVQKSLELTLEECSARLNLPFSAKKIFTVGGEEVTDISTLKDKETYIISTGESFRKPKDSSNQSHASNTIKAWGQELTTRIKICKNGKAPTATDSGLTEIIRPHSVKELLEISNRILEMDYPCVYAYRADGTRVDDDNFASLRDETVFMSCGEPYIPPLESRLESNTEIVKKYHAKPKPKICEGCRTYAVAGNMFIFSNDENKAICKACAESGAFPNQKLVCIHQT